MATITLEQKIEEYLKPYLDLSGVGFCVGTVNATGSPVQNAIYPYGSVYQQYSNGVSATPDVNETLWEIGSCTKGMTGAQLAILEQSNSGLLNELVYDYIKNYFAPYQLIQTVPNVLQNDITFTQLASMDAGLIDWSPTANATPVSTMFSWLLEQSTYPNTGFTYSDLSFALLGYALLNVSNNNALNIPTESLPSQYFDLLNSTILKPLGMSSTQFYPVTSLDHYLLPCGTKQIRSPDGYVQSYTDGLNKNWPGALPAGGLVMTANDAMSWLQANMGIPLTNNPLTSSVLEILRTPTISTNNWGEGQMITQGWFQNEFTKNGNDLTMVTKNGAVPGFKSGFAYQQLPSSNYGGQSDYGVFILSNCEMESVEHLETILNWLINGY